LGGRAGAAGGPVEGDVGEQVGEVDGVVRERRGRVGPVPELLAHPGEQPDRCGGERGRERVGAGPLDRRVGGAVAPDPLGDREALALARGEGGDVLGLQRGAGEAAVDVGADHAVGGEAAQLGRDERAGVAAHGTEARVAEAGHQLRPRACDARVAPAGLAPRRREPNPGSEGTTTWNASAGSPPWRRGSASGPTTSSISTTEPGQPWVTTSGSESGSGERTCRAWIGCRRGW